METTNNAVPVCPRCDGPLTLGQSNQARVWGCLRCGGVWLDTVSTHKVGQCLDQDMLYLADGAARVASSEGDASRGWVLCPVCKHNMRPTKIEVAQTTIDICKEHGAWFDRHELQKVMTVMAKLKGRPGGGGAGFDAATTALHGEITSRAVTETGTSTGAAVGGFAVEATAGLLGFLFDL